MYGGAGPSTSGAPLADAGAQYTCEDWVSRLSANKMGQIVTPHLFKPLVKKF